MKNVTGIQLGQVILDLYRLCREGPFRSFQDNALDLIKGALEFDSAWWGNASGDTMQIHRIHLYNVADSIIEDYPKYMDEDVFRDALINRPGVTVSMDELMPSEEWVRTRMYQEYAVKYKVYSTIGTLLIDPITSLFEFLTVWRHNTRPFTAEQRAIKQTLMPHLVEAHRLSRLYHVMGRELKLQARNWAIADASAYLREIMPGFAQVVREEWPGWTASRLPAPLHEAVAQSGSFKGRRIFAKVRPYEHLRFVEVRVLTMIDRLSDRELQVARHFAAGRTNTEIATELGVSPATVRNLIARSYSKLDVGNKAELVLRLQEDL